MEKSRFFRRGGDSDSDSDSSSGSSEDANVPQQRAGRFAAISDSESDSEDEKRVVISRDDKAKVGLNAAVDGIRNAKQIGDWSTIQEKFDDLNKVIKKSHPLGNVPGLYIRVIAELEQDADAAFKNKDALNKMAKLKQQALKKLRERVIKHNKDFKDEIADFLSNPNDKKYEVKKAESRGGRGAGGGAGGDSSGDDDGSDDDDDDDGSDDDNDEDEVEDESDDDSAQEIKAIKTTLTGRNRWLKDEVLRAMGLLPPLPEGRKRRDQPDTERPSHSTSAQSGAAAAEDKYSHSEVKQKAKFTLDEKMTTEELEKKVAELVASRGRKGTDIKDMTIKLELMSKIAKKFGSKKEIPILMHLISAMFDANRSIDDYMDIQQWRSCYRCLSRVVTLLAENKSLVLGVITTEELSDFVLASQNGKKETEEVAPVEDKDENVIRVVGTLEAFIVLLEKEYTKSLQQINPHTQDYVIRLSDEANLVELADAIREYYVKVDDSKASASVSLMVLEHVYYKHDSVAASVQKAHLFSKTWGKHSDLHPACKGKFDAIPNDKSKRNTQIVHPASFSGSPVVAAPVIASESKVDQLTKFIFAKGDENDKQRALLCAVFHHALHDRYYQARDLFLISHIQDVIDKADLNTQILYNRALASLGLVAFRMGLIQKAHDSLSGICSGRVKELLAQGQSKWMDKDPEQERQERRRQMPYHMHISPDLLESCHLICAMFIELPQIAKGSPYQIVPKFRKYMTIYNKQDFTGPPENIREHILSAAKALMSGEWQRACDLILGLESWNLIPNNGAEKVKEMLRNRIKEEAVRTYLLTYGVHYESLSLAHICQMFDMEPVVTRRIISRMIFYKEISAAWEHPADTLVMYNVDPTPLQSLCQVVAEKISNLVESNERILDPFAQNVYGFKDDGRKQWDGNQTDRRRLGGWKSSGRGAGGGVTRGGGRGRGGRGRGGRGGGGRGGGNYNSNKPQKAWANQ